MSDESQTEARAANLFDIRRILGGLFVVYGVLLVIMGLGASEADKRRADGVNVNLSVGIALLLLAAFFIAWALLRPLGRELAEAEASD
jgi:NADH:ubiquinone oxidoreductase subunit 4 (subunit M)